jgi:outer membrane protein OmpA-like peptidoglycan-associated protein/curved DNA-binding protein CbpA
MKDYYYLLGLKYDASSKEIKTAYRKSSQKFHPDKNGGDEYFTERFKDILEAYSILSDAEKKAIYDQDFNPAAITNEGFSTNTTPHINYFKVNNTSFQNNEVVTFYWEVINVHKVILKPFGIVNSVGEKAYKIKDFHGKQLKVELVAENTFSGKVTKQTIVLNNKIYEHFSQKKEDSRNTNDPKKLNQFPVSFYILGIGTLVLLLSILFFNNSDNKQNTIHSESSTIENNTLEEMLDSYEVNSFEYYLLNCIKSGVECSDNNWFNFQNVQFYENSPIFVENSTLEVENIARILSAFPDIKIKIGGYTDSYGDAKAKLKLSNDRAVAIKRLLISLGVKEKRIQYQGYGYNHPIANNSTQEGRIQNNRVAITIIN